MRSRERRSGERRKGKETLALVTLFRKENEKVPAWVYRGEISWEYRIWTRRKNRP